MESPLTLVVNLSLRSIRVIIFEDNGNKIYEDWLPIRTYINGVTVEQDPNEWWELLCELLKKVFSDQKLKGKIKYITITSSALCLVLLDKKGKVLEKSYMVSDKRASVESLELREKFADFFEKNKGFKAEPSYMFPKILWLKRQNKLIFNNTYKFVSANDFFVYRLTGKFVTDNLNSEKFYFDSSKKSYPSKILQLIGITKRNLADVVDPGTVAGEVKESIKKDFMIKRNIKVIISTYDAICALIGSSSYQEGELNNVCGTCSSYRTFSKKPLESKNSLLCQNFISEKTYILGASNNLEGGVLEWAKECFYGDSYLKDDDFLYDLMQNEAKESALGANGIIFLPYLLGERVPFLDPDVRGNFFGIERFHNRKDIVRSVFEATAFQARLILEEFEKNGLNISSLNMSGGASRMEFAAQLRADVLGLPVNTLTEVETTALGAFMLVKKARKEVKTIKDLKHLVKVKKQYIPNMHNHNCYSSLFILYKEFYNGNKELFKKRRQVFDKIIHYRKKVLENL